MSSTSSGVNGRIQIVDNVDGELLLKTSNLQGCLHSQISNYGQDFPVAVIGFVGRKQSGKTFTASLIHNYLSVQGLGPRTRATETISTAIKDTRSSPTSSGMSLWEKPFLVKNGTKFVLVWLVEFSAADMNLQLAKMVCTRVVEVITSEETRIVKSGEFASYNKQPNSLCTNVAYVIRKGGISGPRLSKNFFRDIVLLNHSLLFNVNVVNMAEIQHGRVPHSSALSGLDGCISDIVNESAISENPKMTLGTITKHLDYCCTFLSKNLAPTLDRGSLTRQVLTGKMKAKMNWPLPKNQPPQIKSKTKNRSSWRVISLKSKSPTPKKGSLPGFKFNLEKVTLNFYDNTMTSILAKAHCHFSAREWKRIHFELCTNIVEIFENVNRQGSSHNHLRDLEEALENHFNEHKLTNARSLKGKADQVEKIIEKLKRIYNKKVEEIKLKPDASGITLLETWRANLEDHLKQEIWEKISPAEPIENHWACLKSQLAKIPKNSGSKQFTKRIYEDLLGIQLNFGMIEMGILNDGEYLTLENEHDKLQTSTFVGVTKGSLLYGSNVIRAEKKGILLKKHHIGLHFEPKEDTFEPNKKYEIFVRKQVRLVGIEFLLGFVLKKLKIAGERKMEKEFSSCLITVPFYYASYQRQEVKCAAIVAGFKTVKIVSDTTAAAFQFAHFSTEMKESVYKSFRVLTESNGNLYAGICTFKTKDEAQLTMKMLGMHYPPENRLVSSSKETKIKENTYGLFKELTKSYSETLKLGSHGNHNPTVLGICEHQRWVSFLASILKERRATVATASPLQGALHLQKFEGQVKEIIPNQISSLPENMAWETNFQRDINMNIVAEEMQIFQKLFGKISYPIGTLRLLSINPGLCYTLSLTKNINGEITLGKVIGEKKGSEGPICELERGKHFRWECSEMHADIPGTSLLVNKLFARSVEEMKRKEGVDVG